MQGALLRDLRGHVALTTLTLISMVLCLGCGPTDFSGSQKVFRTSGGAFFIVPESSVAIDAKTMSEIEIDIISRMVLEAGWTAEKMWPAVSYVNVNVLSEPFKCGDETCDGTEDGFNIIVADDPAGCPWAGAYAHELTHLFSLAITSDADAEHKNENVWAQVLKSNNSHECK